MISKIFSIKNPFRVHLLFFVLAAIIVNIVALIHIPWFSVVGVAQFFAFIYIVLTPGLFILPFLTQKKLPFALGIALSGTLSILFLMLAGLGVNTILPFFGIQTPLTTIPLIVVFDISIFILFVLNDIWKGHFAIHAPRFSRSGWFTVCASILLPIVTCLGALNLNNGGSNFLLMFVLTSVIVLAVIVMVMKNSDSDHESPAPIILFMFALAFLLMNSLRGWFISGHDILLEYHVFILTNNIHLWSMALYQDPYMACLSLTILPTYLQNLLHVSNAYIFKFFIQFIGALSVVIVYYLTKEYTSDKIAFLTGLLYITFPTFLVDMAFLNRQGIAFLFFGALVFTLLTSEYFSRNIRFWIIILFGVGVIISHYSTSYIAIAILICSYVTNIVIRFIVSRKKPRWLLRLTTKLNNMDMYQRPILLTLPVVLILLATMIFWSTFITKTSTSLIDTIKQIITTIEHPFSLDESSGPAKYNLFQSRQKTPQQLFDEFRKNSIKAADVAQYQSAFYPLSLTQSYPAIALAEMPAPLTSFGAKLQSIIHLNITNLFNLIKQVYAKIIQVLLIIGLIGLIFGYSFKKNILRNVPTEYLALSISGIVIMVGQTILPASAINYGLLRLFQQNLIFLALPIILGLMWLVGLVSRTRKVQLSLCTSILLFFFIILSGLFPQLTGGSRPLMTLANSGLYYDSYYTHAQEVSSAEWLAQNGNLSLTVQAAHFSDMKMLAYGQIGAYIELLPETAKKSSYVYLNFYNVESDNILEILDGNVVYYHFPMEFLDQNKNLIYNNGGSEIYR